MLKNLQKSRNSAKSKRDIIRLTEEIGNYFFTEGKFTEALIEYKDLLSLTNDNLPIPAHRLLCETYLELDNNSNAIFHAILYLYLSNKADKLEDTQRAYVTLARCLMNLADTFIRGKIVNYFNLLSIELLKFSITLTNSLKKNSKSKEEIAETKAISLFNIGFSYSKVGLRNKASEAFYKCIEICKCFNLIKLLLKSLYQFIQLLLIDPTTSPAKLDIIKQESKKILVFMRNKKIADSEARCLYESIFEAHLNIEAGIGNFRKALKKMRCLALKFGTSKYTEKIKNFLLLDLFVRLLPQNEHNFIKKLILLEKISDLYAGYEVEFRVLQYTREMLKCIDQIKSEISSFLHFKCRNLCLVSLAESMRNMYEFKKCAKYYREQIDWALNSDSVISQPPDKRDISSSYLARAKALFSGYICSNEILDIVKESANQFLTKEIKVNIEVQDLYIGGKTIDENEIRALDDLNEAKRFSNEIDDIPLKHEILTFLKRFHDETFNLSQSKGVQSQLDNLTQVDDSSSESIENEENIQDLLAPLVDATFLSSLILTEESISLQLEALSSDSEIDELLDYKVELEEHAEISSKQKRNVVKSFNTKRNTKGETALHIAVISGNFANVKHLIEIAKHPINTVDGAGWSPLHEACFHNHYQIALYLLEKGAILDHVGCDKSTPLFESLHGKAFEISRVLINKGANLWHINAEGETMAEILSNIKQESHALRKAIDNILSLVKTKLGDSFDKWVSLKAATGKLTISSRKKSEVTIVSDESSDDEKTSDHSQDGVDIYQNAIKGLGSKISSRPKCNRKSSRRNLSSSDEDMKRSKKAKIAPVFVDEDISVDEQLENIEPVDDRWIIDDTPANRKKKKDKKVMKKTKTSLIREKSLEITNPKFESTQIESFDLDTGNRDLIPECPLPTDLSPSLNEFLFTAKVAFHDIAVGVPITKRDLKKTFGWLSEEVLRRRQNIFPSENFFGSLTLINEITGCAMTPCEKIDSMLYYLDKNSNASTRPDSLLFKVLITNKSGVASGDIKSSFNSRESSLSRQNSNASSITMNSRKIVELDEYTRQVLEFLGDIENISELDLSYGRLNCKQVISILNKIPKNIIKFINLKNNNFRLDQVERKEVDSFRIINEFPMLCKLDLGQNQFTFASLSKIKSICEQKGVNFPNLKSINISYSLMNDDNSKLLHQNSLETLVDCMQSLCPHLESLICHGFNLRISPDPEFLTSVPYLSVRLQRIDLSYSCINIDVFDQLFKSDRFSFESPIILSLKGCHTNMDCMNQSTVEFEQPQEGVLPLKELNLDSTNLTSESVEKLSCILTVPHGQFDMCFDCLRVNKNPALFSDIKLIKQMISSIQTVDKFTFNFQVAYLNKDLIMCLKDFISTDPNKNRCKLEITIESLEKDNWQIRNLLSELIPSQSYSLSNNLLVVFLR